MRKPTVLQINAVALSVALGGSYVYYRAAQGQQQRDQVMTSSKMRPLTAQRLAAHREHPIDTIYTLSLIHI